MVLAMVVVGALVGAGALGHRVIQGFSQSEDFGKGLVAAIAIVLLGVMLDRITQGAGRRRPAPRPPVDGGWMMPGHLGGRRPFGVPRSGEEAGRSPSADRPRNMGPSR